MKIKVDNAVFLQKYDIRFLLQMLTEIPSCVLHEIIKERSFYENSPLDGLEFCYTFTDPNSIEWLMAQDAIVDFKECSSSTYENLVKEVSRLELKYYDVSIDVTVLRPKYESKTVSEEFEIHKLLSLKLMLLYEQHLLNFQIPKAQKRQSLIWRIFNRSAH